METNDYELDSYVALIAEASEIIAQLSEYVEDHGEVSPEHVGTAHVERMRAIVSHLRSAARIAGRK